MSSKGNNLVLMNNNSFTHKLRRFLGNHGTLITFGVLFLFASLRYPYFFTWLNIRNLLRQGSMIGLVSVGMTLILIIGGIDLSVGSVLAVAGVWAANLSSKSLVLAICVPLLIGLTAGFINGLVVTRFKIVPFIATLAMMIGMRGVAFLSTGAISIRIDQLSKNFMVLGRSFVFGIPLPAIIFIGTIILAASFAKYTKLGRELYAVGDNEEAANMMGVNVNRVKMFAYVSSGLLSSFAGIMLASRLGAGQPVAGDGWELDAITAAVIGGTLLTGGKGKFSGTFLGVLIIGIITNMFNMDRNINTWWEHVVKGLILLIAVILQSRASKRVDQ